MSASGSIIIGTRSSRLAVWQAEYVRSLLLGINPDINIDLFYIKTGGDKLADVSLSVIGGTGAFTKEIEYELLKGTIDIAVHSLKDLPGELTGRLKIACVPQRHKANDVIIAREPGVTIETLPKKARIATGSVRREAQILNIRPDIEVIDIRGNVNTRIEKFLKSDWDAMILAAAGVERLGLQAYISSYIPVNQVIPAVGQGALGIEIREDRTDLAELLTTVDHETSHIAVRAERAFLKAMGGGCRMPIAAYAVITGNVINIEGMVSDRLGTKLFREKLAGNINDPENTGRLLAEKILERCGYSFLQG